MLAGNDQGVSRRAGKDVEEGYGPFLFKDRMGGSVAAPCAFLPVKSMGTRSTT
jgi:hypothetical protein